MTFYTNVYRSFNKLYVRGVDENGKRFKKEVKYKPYLFRPTEGGFYRTVNGTACDKVYFNTMKEADFFLREMSDVSNVQIYGLEVFPYTYIYDEYPGEVQYDPSKVVIASIDIECAADEGFPDIHKADKEVTAISVRHKGNTIAFGCGEFTPKDKTITYVRCVNEFELLDKFLTAWDRLAPDIVTGWNTDFFDIPYLVYRMRNLGIDYKRLSPWGEVKERKVVIMNKESQVFNIAGISSLDYLTLYKKFSFTNQETYKLGYIAQVELGDAKVDYSEYGSLLSLYKENFQLFMEYNVHDAVIVDRLEAKLNFIQQVMALAYDSKVNYNDTFTTVRSWDVMIHNYLLDRRIVIPHVKKIRKERRNVGGYVKEPRVGLYKWVVSFDLKSSYPHNIMQYNISPETMVGKEEIPDIDTLIAYRPKLLGNPDVAIAANGCIFRKDKIGFLAALMKDNYDKRNEYVRLLGEAEAEYERTKNPALLNDIAKYHNMQMAKKIQLNSAYGAIANEYFRWFSLDLAEAITTSAQLAVIWIADAINKYINKVLKTEGVDYVIASDTDSVYLDMGKVAALMRGVTDPKKITKLMDHFCKERLEPYIASQFKELADYMQAYENTMAMARETIAEKGIWTGKKHYILNVWDKKGVSYDKPKLKVVGIESVRSSTPHVCRQKINEAISIVMNKDEAALQEFVSNFKEQFIALPFEDIAKPSGCNDMLEYSDPVTLYRKGTPAQVKAGLIFNHQLNKHGIKTIAPIQSGDKIRWAYLREPNPIHQTVIGAPDYLPKEFKLEQYINKDLQFEKTFLNPVQAITDVIGWHTEQQASLASWFS